MLMECDARERTVAEYDLLLDGAGFRLTRVVKTASAYRIVEAVAI